MPRLAAVPLALLAAIAAASEDECSGGALCPAGVEHRADREDVGLLQVGQALAELGRAGEAGAASAGPSRNCARAPASSPGQGAADRLGASWRGRSSSFFDAPPMPIPKRPPKLALLMVVRRAILNARLWSSWLHDADKQGLKVRILIHTTLGLVEDFPAELRASVVPERVAVERCNALNATMLLIGRALEDHEVTHVMTVSDDSIPVKPLHHIYWRLERSPQSRLCTDDTWLIPRAETWWVLRRGDAELFHASRNSEFLQTFRDAKTPGCDDESFFYLALKTRMQKWSNAHEASFLNKCPMYTDWRYGEGECKAWADHAGLCDCESLEQHVVAAANPGHPASFGDIGGEAFIALLRSPFWFARKVVNHSEAAARAAEEAWEAYSR